ncbi:MAG TPA: hypothetical protein VIM16_08940 [Mucilaginibacter sp.]|jgi:hypothetical protein
MRDVTVTNGELVIDKSMFFGSQQFIVNSLDQNKCIRYYRINSDK